MYIDIDANPTGSQVSPLASFQVVDVKVYAVGGTLKDIFAKGTYSAVNHALSATLPMGSVAIVAGQSYDVKCHGLQTGKTLAGTLTFAGQAGGDYQFSGVLQPAMADAAAQDTGTSDLVPTLSDVPWQDFAPGVGIDAVTGESSAGSALEAFRTAPSRSSETHESLDVLVDFESVREKIEVSTQGSYNIGSVTLDQSNDYLGEIQQSAIEMTYIAEYRARDAEYAEPPEAGYRLTEAARKLAADPAAFRRSFGDYFVATRKEASVFRAVYALKAKSSSELQSFKSSVGVSVEGLFSQKGSAGFESEAARLGIEISLEVRMIGVTDIAGQPPVATPSDIPAALAWFKKHRVGTPWLARLEHYSRLIPGYPTTVDVPPRVFVELRQLYALLWQVRVMYHSLPAFYAGTTGPDFIAFDSGVTAHQSSLANDKARRDRLASQGRKLLDTLTRIRARQRLLEDVLAARANEPGQGHKQEATHGAVFWSHGVTFSPDPENIQIAKTTLSVHEGYRIGWRKQTLHFADPARIVVGWEVRSNWTDGSNGFWEQGAPTNLGNDNAAVFVQSDYDRGYDWTVSYYHVAAADYQHFDAQ